MQKILVTGAAGFIGFHLCKKLLSEGHKVVGYDSINKYYDVNLKYSRLGELGLEKDRVTDNVLVESSYPQFSFIKARLENETILDQLCENQQFDAVVNLAAQPGVRYSVENPRAYLNSNIIGFFNILEAVRKYKIGKLVYSSSSSIYGSNIDFPFTESQKTETPLSLYAATKKSNELLAHSYSNMFGINTIGLRFFTVYGPWGRPDMAMMLFPTAIMANEPITVFNNGQMWRDFTYVADIVEGVYRTVVMPSADTYAVYNIGNGSPVCLNDCIEEIEKNLGKKAKRIEKPIQVGDVTKTWADTTALEKTYGYKPETSINEGVAEFMAWYKDRYC